MLRIFDTKCRPNKSHNCQLRKGSQKFPQNWNRQKLKLTSSGVHNDQIFCLVMNMKIKISTSKMMTTKMKMTTTMIMLTTMMIGDKSNLSRRAILGRHCRADWPWWCRAPATWSSSTTPSSPPPPPHGHHPHHLHLHRHHHDHDSMMLIHLLMKQQMPATARAAMRAERRPDITPAATLDSNSQMISHFLYWENEQRTLRCCTHIAISSSISTPFLERLFFLSSKLTKLFEL